MKAYIGTKIIKAVEMTDHDFGRKFKGTTPEEGKLSHDGYMVEYTDGYRSWSPKPTFEAAYREVSDKEVQILESTIPEESEKG